ncbi:unnamed protein product [Cuscuta campestris]|uniref:UBN2 domain-containing protein n=1 Tax=Cuscuta campestris TaxID=132261 RepID=A0A484L5L0_9ASTE|nr:unnamed protein product [Cuscuta campestris]
MRIYIQSTNFLLWRIIKNGEDVPMKKVEETNVPKTENEYDAQDIKKVENNAKAINIIYCVVNPDDYRKISCCTTAKEMWDKLEITYEGTDQVREAKIDFLTHEYELFRMKENEKIDEMFERFSKIVNDLHALKKTYTDKELVRKILRSLTPEWRSKADAIQESIGITNVTIDGLRGNLKTYQSTILFPSLGEQKKKGIALKATSSQEPAMEESSDEDNEFGLVIKKFHKFMRKEYERKGKKHGGPPKCYGDDVMMPLCVQFFPNLLNATSNPVLPLISHAQYGPQPPSSMSLNFSLDDNHSMPTGDIALVNHEKTRQATSLIVVNLIKHQLNDVTQKPYPPVKEPTQPKAQACGCGPEMIVIYSNTPRHVQTSFRGSAKAVTWKFICAAKAATVRERNWYMKLLDKEDPAIQPYLARIGFSKWSRAESANN